MPSKPIRQSTRISEAVTEWSATTKTLTVVQRLAQLVAEQDYKTVRDEVIKPRTSSFAIPSKEAPSKPSLTTTFNTIHAIVREL